MRACESCDITRRRAAAVHGGGDESGRGDRRARPARHGRDVAASVGLTLALVVATAYGPDGDRSGEASGCTPDAAAVRARCLPGPLVLGVEVDRGPGPGGDGARIDLGADPLPAPCPAIRPVATITRYDAEYLRENAPNVSYLVTVMGTVVNRSDETAVVRGATLRIHLPDGSVQDAAVPGLAGARVAPGTSLPWAAVTLASGLRQAEVSPLRYGWAKPSLRPCPL